MTVSTTNTEVSYTADGVQTVFSFNFQAQLPSDVIPSIEGVDQTTGFTTTLSTDQDLSPGGDVTFDTPPTDQFNVTIRREMPLTQETDYNPYDPFPAETHEAALDKLTMTDQQLNALIADLSANKIEWTAAPTTSSDSGVAGQIAYDSTYVYLCTATDTWARITLETW